MKNYQPREECADMCAIIGCWKAMSLSSMFKNPYRFNIYIFMFTNEIRPNKSHTLIRYAQHKLY